MRLHLESSPTIALLLGVGLASLLEGCVSRMQAIQNASAGQIGCLPEEVEVTNDRQTFTSSTWMASCRGQSYSCSAVAGGNYSTIIACSPLRQAPGEQGAPPAAASPRTSSPGMETAEINEIRTALDNNRDAIFACTGLKVIGIKATITPNRMLDVRLNGDLAGTQQEACVRQVVGTPSLGSATPGTSVIHVVR